MPGRLFHRRKRYASCLYYLGAKAPMHTDAQVAPGFRRREIWTFMAEVTGLGACVGVDAGGWLLEQVFREGIRSAIAG
ncbi:hypothetical protein AWB69_08009 [Caballeronia udeis]|uniref:Uncharacterized protein n=1 Tax=Caballeronia udeis TaxID=1232866 RepID=A0A158JHP6_9BURK|nr:hypothetical protein AWB69_08009 [Caballeronia udeis]